MAPATRFSHKSIFKTILANTENNPTTTAVSPNKGRTIQSMLNTKGGEKENFHQCRRGGIDGGEKIRKNCANIYRYKEVHSHGRRIYTKFNLQTLWKS